MKRSDRSVADALLIVPILLLSIFSSASARGARAQERLVELPAPSKRGGTAVERALEQRRSTRSWASAPLTLEEIAQLLWAAQGITAEDGGRAAPSAGALYPLEVLLVATDVGDLEPGIYRYQPVAHRLQEVAPGDFRPRLTAAAWNQSWMRGAPAALVIAGVVERTAVKYGSRARRYVHIEVGAAAENVYLQATAIGLGTTLVGAFDDGAVSELLRLDRGEEPLAILPVGRLRSRR